MNGIDSPHGYDGADRHLQTSNGTTTGTYIRDLTDQVVEYRLNGVAQNRYSGSVTLDATATNVVERTVGLPGGVTLTPFRVTARASPFKPSRSARTGRAQRALLRETDGPLELPVDVAERTLHLVEHREEFGIFLLAQPLGQRGDTRFHGGSGAGERGQFGVHPTSVAQ
ncbi:unannotated protein [freshwater metagenome]|uniref:Unannotated protein n=1 Tax=freshwater metagenome TaxID=449393 RepID=A0A6J7A0K0_9ZZZZ